MTRPIPTPTPSVQVFGTPEHFLKWVAENRLYADTYLYGSPSNCPLAQYAQAFIPGARMAAGGTYRHLPSPYTSPTRIAIDDGEGSEWELTIDGRIEELAVRNPDRSWGGLADMVEKQLINGEEQ